MEKSILNCILKIVIHMSALMSVLKTKNKILNILLECIYCVVISALPILFVSIFIVVVNGNESVNIGTVIGWVSYLVWGAFIYFVISNRDSEKKVEDYMLLGALYFDEYINNKPQIKKQKFILITELINYILVFIGGLCGIILLLGTLKILSFAAIMFCFVLNLFLTYVLFVYGKCDEETRKRRKTILGTFISIIWVIVVCVRINQFWCDMTQVGLEDMLILFLSAVFTIPTIYGWVKNIPRKIVEPHTEKVYARRDEIIGKYVIVKKEVKEFAIQVCSALKTSLEIIIFKWKNGEKREIIKLIFIITVAIVIMFLMLWLGNNIMMLSDKLIEWVGLWYNNLDNGVRNTIEKIFVLFFLIGMMIYVLFKAPSFYVSKVKRLEKIKYIIELVVSELMFGYVAGMILFYT